MPSSSSTNARDERTLSESDYQDRMKEQQRRSEQLIAEMLNKDAEEEARAQKCKAEDEAREAKKCKTTPPEEGPKLKGSQVLDLLQELGYKSCQWWSAASEK